MSSEFVEAGCYELYVEDDRGCDGWADTEGPVGAGSEFVWTVREEDLVCPRGGW